MIETVVKSIRFNRITNNRVVLLKETAGDRYLPIWIGEFEAHAIALRLGEGEANTEDFSAAAL